MLKGLIPYFAVLCLAVSCAHPSTVEDFRSVADRDSLGRFSYGLDMTDSVAVYDISFYTRFDCPKKQFKTISDIRIDVELLSPSGLSYEETVYLPVNEFKSDRKGTYDSCVVYRKDLVPVEWGVWTMNLTLEDLKGLRGMGVIKSKR